MTAIVFALTTLERGQRIAHALTCIDARYVSVLWDAAERISRRFLSPPEWLALQEVLTDTLEPGPLPADGAVSAALLTKERRPAVIVQYLYKLSVDPGPQAAVELDQILTALGRRPHSRFEQE